MSILPSQASPRGRDHGTGLLCVRYRAPCPRLRFRSASTVSKRGQGERSLAVLVTMLVRFSHFLEGRILGASGRRLFSGEADCVTENRTLWTVCCQTAGAAEGTRSYSNDRA
jgi:hypothetical protein